MNKKRKFIGLLFFSSFLPYLEWGTNQSAFLFQAEWELLSKFIINPTGVLHPLTILPLLGQIILLISFFLKSPSSYIFYWSIALLGILIFFLLLIGLIKLNFLMILFSLPFSVLSAYLIFSLRKESKYKESENFK